MSNQMVKKKFQTTGVCVPNKHYMIDISSKLEQILHMVEEGNYFTINQPRQFGKTTTLSRLAHLLTGKKEFYPLRLSFEGIGVESFQAEAQFLQTFFIELKHKFRLTQEQHLLDFLNQSILPSTLAELGSWITDFVLFLNQKVVLMIDEVDQAANSQLFLDFLGLLRKKFLMQIEEEDITFHSVILTGVHDIKNLKPKFQHTNDTKLNSPWNIAVEFKIDMEFSAEEISTMLLDFSKVNHQEMEVSIIAERLFHWTSGYPFLVSRLCQILDENRAEMTWNHAGIC